MDNYQDLSILLAGLLSCIVTISHFDVLAAFMEKLQFSSIFGYNLLINVYPVQYVVV